MESDRPADPSIAGLAQQVDDAVERVRREFRQRAAEEWSLAVPLLRTALDLCSTLKARRLALDGRSEAELFREILNRSLKPPEEPPDFTTHSDAEIFLGLMCVESSRSRVVAWEIGARGAALVDEAFDRIRRAAPAREVHSEGVHWALSLVDRVRDGSVEPQFLSMAVRLLRISAGSEAPMLLAGYLEKEGMGSYWLLDDGELRNALTAGDLERLLGKQLIHALDEAAETGDLNALRQACERLAHAGVELSTPEVLGLVDARIGAVTAAVRERSPLRHRADRQKELHGLLAAVLPMEWWHRLLRSGAAGRQAPAWPILARLQWPPPRLTGAVATVAVVGLLVFRFIDAAAEPERGTGMSQGEPGGAAAASPEATALTVIRARLAAAGGDWDQVVEMLTAQEPDATAPQAIQWDSLLAAAAFRRAATLLPGDPDRGRLLRLAHERSTRVIAASPAFATAADELRLLRAEACIAGPLDCFEVEVTEDLVVAARSRSGQVSERAGTLLATRRPEARGARPR